MKLKQLLIILLTTILFLFSFDVTNVKAQDASKLVIHYHRYAADYDDWSIWLWQDGREGVEVQFDATDEYGAVATFDLVSNGFNPSVNVGIIIAQIPEWTKDIEADRYLDISQPNAYGEVHAYLLEGEPFISYVSDDQVGCNHDVPNPFLCAQTLATGLLDAYFDTSLTLHVLSTEVLNVGDINVYENGILVGFTGSTLGSELLLTLDNGVDVTSIYEIEILQDGGSIQSIVRVDADYDSSLFASAYHYDGPLGMEWTETSTTLRVWAPLSSKVQVNLYEVGHTSSVREDGVDTPAQVVDLTYQGKGVWSVTLLGNFDGWYYTFNVKNGNTWVLDIQDPYGVSFGLNGARSMILDLSRTNPDGWESDSGVDGYQNPANAIIYELHVRDLTSESTWNGPEEYRGKYMGFTVEGTSYTNPISGVTVSTGLDHLKELGITHVHLLPTYDQDWNDERNFQFNWGYNPQNYNSPEGGYATDPFDGAVRVNEFKQMVQALHSNGINVITDMVYNHTGPGSYFSFNRIVPDYMYRLNPDGSYSNGTGVGNETASERYMFRKFIKDSMVYWATEYHIDGFRFDLMAVHDYETMNEVAEAVEAINPNIFVYGEPWGGGTIALPYDMQAGKNNLWRMPLIAAFNDELRNTIKGSPDGNDAGYVTSGEGIYTVMNGLSGGILGSTSTQSINYVTAHDNLTLYDKLKLVHSASGYTEEIDYEARLANSIILFSQGIPFLHSGVDFLRTKGGNSNSYDAPDIVNQLSWVRKSMYVDSFEYYKGLIEIRKHFDSFKMQDRSDISQHLTFLYPEGFGMIGMRLTKNGEDVLVYFNGGKQRNQVTLPEGAWTLLADRDEAGLTGLGTYSGAYPIEEAETLVFVPGDEADVIPSPTFAPEITNIFSVIFEGATFNLTSNTAIYAYSIDGFEYISVLTPSSSIQITNLTIGFHTIRIKNMYGQESDAFTLQVLPQDNVIECDDGYHEEDGQCVADEVEPLVCDGGFHEENGQCVENVVYCQEDYELIDGECVLKDVPEESTGCFGAISLDQVITLTVMVVVAGGIIIIFRRR